jgi:GNAT superfamily N-acetyltransferase
MTNGAGAKIENIETSRGPRSEEAFIIREASTADLDALGEMFSRSSAETVYGRFYMAYPRVPEWMLARLLGGGFPGGRSVVAVVGGEVVGHAMHGPPEVGEAEVAVVVEDGWQRRGVGRHLLTVLAQRAREEGIEAFVATVLGGNRLALRLGESVFGAGEARVEYGCYVLRAPLHALLPLSIGAGGAGCARGAA